MADLNAAFWKWFGDSVVRNTDGSPKVVYHGSIQGDGALDDFDSDRLAFFTPSRRIAREYAHGDAKSVGAYYLCLQNPLRVDGPKDVLQELDPELQHTHRNAEHSWEVLRDRSLPELYQDDDVIAALIARGYDGLILRDDLSTQYGTHTSYVVFQPEQIKAIDNDGTWDRDDPSIRSNPFGDRRVLSRQEAEAYVAAGSIPVTRTEGYTPVFFAEDAIAQQKGPWDWHGMYYFVGEDGDEVIPLGPTFIFNNKVDAMIQLGYSRKKVASKLHYYFDGHHKRGVTIDEFLEPYISGKTSRWYGDWADSFIAQQAKRNGADNVILLREPNAEHGYNTGTEVVDLHSVKTKHWSGVDLHEMFGQNPDDGLGEA